MKQSAQLIQIEKFDTDWSITHTEVDGVVYIYRYEITEVDDPAK